ncbi:hypothetical protein GCM10010297_58570 [Streptomyces malachitofuscus]|nr:hypothetical protein GCM10010297_58570 [Streptomyces malachitofuscus]
MGAGARERVGGRAAYAAVGAGHDDGAPVDIGQAGRVPRIRAFLSHEPNVDVANNAVNDNKDGCVNIGLR